VQDDPDLPCPFCPGHEEATPPALETYGPRGEWVVRVVPNLYPAFEGGEALSVTNLGPVFTQAPASGIHEILVFSRAHDESWADLADGQAGLVMAAIRDRIAEHSSTPGLRYSQAIINSGREAGASLEHPHAQLLGIPFIPREILEEQAGFERFSGNCVLCATIEAEEEAGHRVVHADERVVVVCPFWSASPFEMLVLPRTHQAQIYGAAPGDLSAAGRTIRDVLHRLRSSVGDVAYNVVLHSAPYRTSTQFHWHVHLVPKMTTEGGFEMGTGVSINVVSPEMAAGELRQPVRA
jgi:UDPglucose--hexose-1-phosphate uridylyltransferase